MDSALLEIIFRYLSWCERQCTSAPCITGFNSDCSACSWTRTSSTSVSTWNRTIMSGTGCVLGPRWLMLAEDVWSSHAAAVPVVPEVKIMRKSVWRSTLGGGSKAASETCSSLSDKVMNPPAADVWSTTQTDTPSPRSGRASSTKWSSSETHSQGQRSKEVRRLGQQ